MTFSTSDVAVCCSKVLGELGINSHKRPALLPHVLEEPRVLDRDYCLVREGLQQADLLVGERSDLLTTHLDVADCDVSPQQGNTEVGPVSPLSRDGAAFRELVYLCLKVSGVDQPPLAYRAATHRPTMKRDVSGRHRAVMGDETQDVSIDAIDDDVERLAQPGCAARDRVEYRLDIGRRVGDDAKYFRGRRLLLQRLVALASELPHVLSHGQRRHLDGARPSARVGALMLLRVRVLAGCPPALECRLIAFPKAQDCADRAAYNDAITAGICGPRNGVEG